MKKRIAMVVISVGVAALWMVNNSCAEMYRWVDEKGVVTFKDYPPPASKKRKVKVYSDDDFDQAPPPPATQATPSRGSKHAAASEPQQNRSRNERFNGTVELYVTGWCGYCKRAIAYLQSRNIPYVAYDIEKDPAARRRYEELGGRGVPLIIVGNHKMSGFSQETLEQYLGAR